jgi:hypothetical protein
MVTSAIALSMSKATRKLEEKARKEQHSHLEVKTHLLHEDMRPCVACTFVARHLLLPGTLVDFKTAEGVTYHDQLDSIRNSVGGMVYLSFFNAKHKMRILKHSEMTHRLALTFTQLLQLEHKGKEKIGSGETGGGIVLDTAEEGSGEHEGGSEHDGGSEYDRHANSSAISFDQLSGEMSHEGVGDTTKLRKTTPVEALHCHSATDLLVRLFARLSFGCFRLERHWAFDMLVITTIIACVAEYAGNAQKGNTQLNEYLAADDTVLKHSQIFFVFEATVKVLANGLKPWAYLKSGWNMFDITLLIVGYAEQPALLVFRMLRLFKVMKILGGRPRRNFEAFIASIISFRVIGTIWVMVICFYAVVGSNLFGTNDPFRFKNGGTAIATLFWASTMDGLSGESINSKHNGLSLLIAVTHLLVAHRTG